MPLVPGGVHIWNTLLRRELLERSESIQGSRLGSYLLSLSAAPLLKIIRRMSTAFRTAGVLTVLGIKAVLFMNHHRIGGAAYASMDPSTHFY